MEIEKRELEEIVYQKLQKLPEFFKDRLRNIEFFVEDGTSDRLLGLYHGIPYGKRTNYNLVMPDKIIIYRKAFQKICKNKKELEDKIEEVLLHEIGHYFGFNEEQLRKLKY
ncbi:MAG: metallopeptidase family protein [Candidatus Omnitrophica bacterium]|nr:metallopeptidase family protein [Candidatus Omnitrophota bacterium]